MNYIQELDKAIIERRNLIFVPSKAMHMYEEWRMRADKKVKRSLFRHRRERQLDSVINMNQLICVRYRRKQTRYVQRNYQRKSYIVYNNVHDMTISVIDFERRIEALKSINFEMSLADYTNRNQRRLMTAELRNYIKKRDNYTCQCCGKYMPDEVGLQVDHIIPVSKGGKTVKGNLQVLCSKCNLSKGNKIT